MKTEINRRVIPILIVCGLLGGVTLPHPALAMSKAEQRQMESAAKKAFYSSDYAKAKEIYSTLLSEFNDHIYLRNIARCYEQMKQPGPALDNFKAYLQKAGDALPAKEKNEINERIAAMEKLVAEARAAEAPKAPPPPPAPPETPPVKETPPPTAVNVTVTTPVPTPPANPAVATRPSEGVNVTQRTPSQPEESSLRPVGIGLLVASGVAAIVGGALLYSSWSTYGDNKDGTCGSDASCKSARDSVSSKNLWSKISFGVAAGTAALGGTIILIAPASRTPGDLSFGMGWTY